MLKKIISMHCLRAASGSSPVSPCFVLGSLWNSGLGDGRMSTFGLVGALVAVLVVVAFSDRRPKHRP